MRSKNWWAFGVGAMALGLSGCAGSDATAKELAALRTELTALRASTGGMNERLDALEIKTGALHASAPPPLPEKESRPYDRPELPTVKLTPDSRPATAEAPAAPPASGPRTRFKSTPSGGIVQEETTGDDSTPVDLNRIKPKPKTDPPKSTDKKPEKR